MKSIKPIIFLFLLTLLSINKSFAEDPLNPPYIDIPPKEAKNFGFEKVAACLFALNTVPLSPQFNGAYDQSNKVSLLTLKELNQDTTEDTFLIITRQAAYRITLPSDFDDQKPKRVEVTLGALKQIFIYEKFINGFKRLTAENNIILKLRMKDIQGMHLIKRVAKTIDSTEALEINLLGDIFINLKDKIVADIEQIKNLRPEVRELQSKSHELLNQLKTVQQKFIEDCNDEESRRQNESNNFGAYYESQDRLKQLKEKYDEAYKKIKSDNDVILTAKDKATDSPLSSEEKKLLLSLKDTPEYLWPLPDVSKVLELCSPLLSSDQVVEILALVEF